ncbi:META domain-containing protein [Variovorax sp. AFSI2.2]|uniref:META domain-containing protein n=1 Tax=Variovorax sp. AFSI2.2 TaxID=3384160 RepID=UPI003EB773A8
MRFLARLALPVFATALAAALSACGSGISLDEPIEGPVWRLAQLGGEPVAPGGDAQIQFDRSSGRVSGSGGCNRVSGSFTRSGVTLRIGQLASTRMACADPVRGANEAQFVSALQTTASYRLAGPGRLALLDASGRTVAMLNAATR